MPLFVLILGKFATFTHSMRYSLISCTIHPTEGWLSSFVDIALDIVSLYRLFLGITYQSLGERISNHFFSSISHVLFLPFSSISLANWPCIFYQSIDSFFLFFLFSFLELFRVNCFLCVIALLVLTATSNGSILFLMYQPKPISSFFIPVFTFNNSSSTIFPRNTQPCNITSSVKFFIHCHKFPGLSVHFLQFILIPLGYSSTIPHNGDCASVRRHYLIPSIQFTLQISFALLKYSFLNLSFISCSSVLSYSNIPKYLYLSSSIYLIFSALGNSILPVDLTFPLFKIITPHFLIPNSILTS